MKYENPIIKGYHPDPSIVRVNDDYYLVNSTFEWYPGVPIFHSKNLANWDLIGYCCTSENGLDLSDCPPSGGIFAPTIRYHNDRFYMTVTNVTHGGNFIINSKEITGPWSNPVYVDQAGIDPSLLFDDDGKVYYTTSIFDKDHEGIYICEVNPDTGEKTKETQFLTPGCGGRYAEGPHLYKINGYYYLMLAEGGTEYAHSETMMRSKDPYGPYEQCPHNPILTNRDVMNEEIKCTGHADIVDDINGNWWMVNLAIRPKSTDTNRTLLHNLGRETFLASVTWDKDGWPHVGIHGTESLIMDAPLPGEPATRNNYYFESDFSDNDLQWAYLRNPIMSNYTFNKGNLLLKGTEITLNDIGSPTLLGIRQPEYNTVFEADFTLESGICGLSAYYSNTNHYDICAEKVENGIKIYLRKQLYDMVTITEPVLLNTDNVKLKVSADFEWYHFSYQDRDGNWNDIGKGITAGLCTEITHIMTFTGVICSVFSENGTCRVHSFKLEPTSIL